MHEIVDLRASPDPRLAERSAVDLCIRPNLNIVLHHQSALLRKDQVLSRLLTSRIPEPCRPQYSPCLHHHAIAEYSLGMDHHPSHQVAITPHHGSILEHHARADAGSPSNPDALADHRGGVDSRLESSPAQPLPNNREGIARI